jgi:hypothetical protein
MHSAADGWQFEYGDLVSLGVGRRRSYSNLLDVRDRIGVLGSADAMM